MISERRSDNRTWEQKNPHVPINVRVEVQGELFKASRSDFPKGFLSHGGGKRGDVTEFSDASRKRMLETVARLDRKKITAMKDKPRFITLTYKNRVNNGKDAKRDLDTFVKRMRRLFSEFSAIWKMEYQGRGAIHFHLLCFNMHYHPIQDKNGEIGLETHWQETRAETDAKHAGNGAAVYTEPKCKNSLDFEVVNSLSGVMYYVSKYMTKDTDDETETATDAGGFMGSSVPHISPQPISAEVKSHEFKPLSQRINFAGAPPASDAGTRPGRFWGVVGRKHFPWAERMQFETVVSYACWQAYADSIDSEFAQPFNGFTVFTKRARAHFDRFDEYFFQHLNSNTAALAIWNRRGKWLSLQSAIQWQAVLPDGCFRNRRPHVDAMRQMIFGGQWRFGLSIQKRHALMQDMAFKTSTATGF